MTKSDLPRLDSAPRRFRATRIRSPLFPEPQQSEAIRPFRGSSRPRPAPSTRVPPQWPGPAPGPAPRAGSALSSRPSAAAGLSKMEGSPPAPFALRLLLLAVLPAAGWLMTVTNELPQPPQARKVGQGGRSAAPPHGPSGEARAGAVGLRRPHRRLLPPAGGPGAGVRVPKTGEGRSIQGNGGSLGEGGERAKRVT